LSQFLRDYHYIPPSGNGHGPTLRYVNLMVTMALGGLWHGAAWTFVAWRTLHGVYLCVNRGYNHYGPTIAPRFAAAASLAGHALTFVSVVFAWAFFRAGSMASALTVLTKMAEDAVDLISSHPEVEFDLYFPPCSILQWVTMRDASPATLKIVYDLTTYISERLTRFPNVRLHDFRAQKRVTHNLDNYGEMIHHSLAVDLEVLSSLADRSHVLDPLAPTASLQRLKTQLEAYRLER
jgi:hypothetical protein